MEIFKVYFCFGFEIVYNVVCVFVEKGEFVKVEEFFMMVYCIGQEVLIEEDVLEEDIEDDFVFIFVQFVYV